MSMKNRAKALARKAQITYQQALKALDDMGQEPADLRQRMQWPLQRADAYCFDPDLDEEYADVSRGARYVHEEVCENCCRGYFTSADKKGTPVAGSDQYCPQCISEYEMWQCDRCGSEVLGPDGELAICRNCFDDLISKD